MRATLRFVVLDRIVVDPAVHFGKPCVRGTRIPVHCVLELVEEGVAFDVIVRDRYPDLSVEDVKACLEWAAAREIERATIDYYERLDEEARTDNEALARASSRAARRIHP